MQNKEVHRLNNKIRELEDKLSEQSFLVNMTNLLMRDGDLNTTIKSTLQLAMEITNSEAGCLFMIETSSYKVKAVEITGQISEELVKAFSELNNILSKQQLNRIVEVNKKNKYFHRFYKLDEKLESFIFLPLVVETDPIGYAVVMHRHEDNDNHSSSYSVRDQINLKIFSHQAALLLDNIRKNIERKKKELYLKTISSLVAAIDAKDIYTQNHSSRVAMITVEFAKFLDFTEEMVELIHYGAILHDVGKIGISDVILNKNTALTDEEYGIIKEHPIKGVNILKPMDLNKGIVDVIKYHHERYDGNGYPDRLKGEEIPLTARVVSIVDAWDAMTSSRAYRKGLLKEEAIGELIKCKGTQFDPYLVDEFLKLLYKNPLY